MPTKEASNIKQETAAKKYPFEVLSAIDMTKYAEQKNGLTYVSWARAWAELKKLYPLSYYTIYETDDHCIYFSDGKSAWVKTGVTVVDPAINYEQEYIEYLPVMNIRNMSVPVGDITSMEVNKAIQRSLTKACARHGLGLYIYIGEDLPDVKRENLEGIQQLRSDIQQEIARCTRHGTEKPMTKEELVEFSKKYVRPVLGDTSFRTCEDREKLETLLSNLREIAA